MGYNCTEENMTETLTALDAVLRKLGVELKASIEFK